MKRYFLLLFFFSCSSVNQMLTPDPKVAVSDFDGSVDIVQDPVSASSSLKGAWHTLGFRWNSNTPKVIFLKPCVSGTENITGLSFNIDGKFLDAEVASTLPEYDSWSSRQMKISLKDFVRLSNADIVKMKIIMIDKYSVSSFGKTKTGAIVNGKFHPFLKLVAEQLKK